MGTIKFLWGLLCVLLVHLATAYPGKSSSSEEDVSQQQQQQNIDSDSIEQFTQKLQSIKGRRQHAPQVTEVQQPEPEAYDPCLDSKKIGPCKARIPRYFFNQATGSCDRFGWGGCGKNGNNFRELSKCETSCSKHLTKSHLDVEQTDKSSVVENCEKPPTDLGPISCAAYIPRWTYNATEEQCVQYIWGGCGKTENNFATEAACKATCSEYPNLKRGIEEPTTQRQPSQDIPLELDSKNICELPSDGGLCLAYFEKYYFNKISNRCELFTYGGCGGNKNRFDTAEDCMRTCGGDSPGNDIQCSDVQCPWALYEHYSTLGCSPIYDGDACCPTRYDCPNQQPIQNNTLEAKSLTLDKDDDGTTTPTPNITVPQKCRYRGKYYAVGEMVDEASDTGSCRAGCICADSYPESGLGPKIMCAQIECPEHLSGRPRGKENCLPLYKKGSCCAYDYYCPEEGLTVIDPNQKQEPEEPTVTKCNVDGEGFYEGQRVYPKKSPCSRCLCQRNADNDTSLEGQLQCEKVDCGIEIYYSHHLARGCAPVYFEKEDGTTSCCPISWECPEDKQQESDNEDSSTPGTQPEIPSTDSPSPPRPPPPSPSSSLTRSAEACGMEKAEGDCKGSRPRFFYNTESKTCERFVYTGCNGNLNNFASYEDCRDLCEPIIALPAPAKGGRDSGLLSRSSLHTPRSQQEPKAISLTEVDPCTQPKRVGRCKGAFPRFYYSPEENECKLFLFGGCRPNANNFYTKDSCEATCLNNIPVENLKTNVPASSLQTLDNLEGDASRVNFGDEIKTIYLRARRPTPPSSASQSSEESNPCVLPPRTGRCKAYVRRYYFDNEENTCKHFTYGGCAGNSNNFRSLEDCNQRCPANGEREIGLHTRRVGPRRGMGWRSATPDGMAGGNQESGGNATSFPPIASLTTRCKLPQSSGSCYASIPSYYYDVESKSCELFFYSGCFGNPNRFITQEECETVCKKPLESEGSNSDVTTVRPGTPQVHELQESSETNSASVDEQEKTQEFCKLDPVPGDCKENQLRFYYDSVAEQCLPFVFTGCKGNENNFVTEAECMSSCGKEPTLEQLSNDLVLSCTFGNITLPLGASLAGHKYEGDEPPCGIPVCQCITPPAVSCVHRKCPQPTTTTTEKICGTPTCLHFCRQAIGPDGCPTCDCNFSGRKGAQPDIVTKYIPPPGSVKG